MSLFNVNHLPDFQYPSLDPAKRVFRLIELLPPVPSLIPGAYGTLRVNIIEVDVDTYTSFEALSYVWGVPSRRQIIVETKDGPRGIYISRSLELALLHLVAHNATHRPLFVDQISINQRDIPEKSHQVQLMRDVYTRCARVIVWLGPSTRGSERYFNYVHEISHEGVLSRIMGPRVGHFMHVFDAVMDPSVEVNEEQREDRDDLLEMFRRFGDNFPLYGFTDVFDRPWFNRLWTIQEVCLAPAIVFVCGNQTLCFDCFRSGALFYNVYNTHWAQRAVATPQHELRQRNAMFDKTAGLIRIFQERKAIHQTGRRQGLYDIVLKYNVNNYQEKIGASLAEDRIFGLLGLAADDNLRQRVRVRYSDGVIGTYTRIAGLLLEENIDILLFAQFPKETGSLPSDTQGLPSWVPDWAMNLTMPVGYSSLKEPVFSAGGPKAGSRFQLDEMTGQLTIRGVLVDRIVHVGDCTHRPEPESQITEQIDYRWAKMFFDEVSEFVREAAVRTDTAQTQLSLRLCDSGLSQKYFASKLGLSAGFERLQALQDSIYQLGQRLLNSDNIVATYHITRIFRSLDTTSWYRRPTSVMDNLHCVLDPTLAGKAIRETLMQFVADVIDLCIASARVSFATYHIKFRRRFKSISFHVPEDHMTRVGLDPNVSLSPDMGTFISNLLKNRTRRLYRTETGFVGLGPAHMMPDDSVVVFHGGTVPHVLRGRETRDTATGNDLWEYLGEAYCDGIMDGEALEAGIGLERTFLLI